MVYTVGQKVENFILNEESIKFDLDDAGAILLVSFNQPTQREIEQFNANKNFEIRFTELENVIIVTAKIGNLDWIDAPYNIHLSQNLSKFILPEENTGLALTLVLIDAQTGIVQALRFMGLSTNFTKRLVGAALEQKWKEFDEVEYYKKIQSIYNKYKTNEIVRMSIGYCKIKGADSCQ